MIPNSMHGQWVIDDLVLQSDGADESIGEPCFKFWLEAGPIMCLQSSLRKVVIKNFRGYGSELAFLRFIRERAKVLQKLVVDLPRDDPALIEDVVTKLKSQLCAKRIGKGRLTIMLRAGSSQWSFSIASNLTLSDPFYF
ncbi:unnamed protein product [Urochloa humidicola]